jgi:hypothetical protein
MSALTASQVEESDSTPRKSAENLFKSAAMGPAGNRRRWMTLPSNALATIEESEDDGCRAGDSALDHSFRSSKKGDLIDGELVLHPGDKNLTSLRSKTQFRVPQVRSDGDTEPLTSFLDSIASTTKTKKKQDKDVNDTPWTSDKQRSLPIDDGVIETAGTAFLDVISKSMGLGHG